MRVVVDTNIVFSAILNTNSLIARVLLQPKTNLNFYSTDLLILEIEEHKDKLIKISGLSILELEKSISLITTKIRFIEANLIPQNILEAAIYLLEDIDIDDTEFVALTNHIHGRLWSGDKNLQRGLAKKGWTKFISTNELLSMIEK
jgi:predicted nucleic acid-binding protein